MDINIDDSKSKRFGTKNINYKSIFSNGEAHLVNLLQHQPIVADLT